MSKPYYMENTDKRPRRPPRTPERDNSITTFPRPSRPSRPANPGRGRRSARGLRPSFPDKELDALNSEIKEINKGARKEVRTASRRKNIRRPAKPVFESAPAPNSSSEKHDGSTELLEGRNAVMEALKSGKPVDSILVKKGAVEGALKVIIAIAREKNVTIREMTKEKLDSISETGKHQGVIAYIAAHEYAEISDILNSAKRRGSVPFIVLLDGITDPRNLGAIIRTAEAAGTDGVIIPRRRGVGLTPAAGKASAGAIAHIPVARVTNISSAIVELKKAGLWVACADMGGSDVYKADDAVFTEPFALVIGGEGGGVSRLVREKCDFTLSVPMRGKINSLNASVAAAVVIYETVRRRSMSAG